MPSVFLLLFVRQALARDRDCRPAWPWTSDPSAFTSSMLGWQSVVSRLICGFKRWLPVSFRGYSYFHKGLKVSISVLDNCCVCDTPFLFRAWASGSVPDTFYFSVALSFHVSYRFPIRFISVLCYLFFWKMQISDSGNLLLTFCGLVRSHAMEPEEAGCLDGLSAASPAGILLV